MAKAVGMVNGGHILLLAGSFEARRVAQRLRGAGVPFDVWVSEQPRSGTPEPDFAHLRRFETTQDMQTAIAKGGFCAVLDASHSYDSTVTAQAFAASAVLKLPYLRLDRPAWHCEDALWQCAADVAAANAMIGQGARVFCTTGWDSLRDYAVFAGEVLMLRQTRHHTRAAPYPFVELVFGDPPFSVADEQALFLQKRVDTLVSRNLGGQRSRPKLDAATALGLRVILIDRPPQPDNLPTVFDIEKALDWVGAQ
ncbi:precorrin-6A/cobalt-precorrin-6A reductase [Sulfitobacter sp. F26169L]|uniref:precorrin-6A/cobalt-precorrin-6A reductase n=1 Tax=Sulfitobacter sp. F26169L TaxID=2996015 RepID=UPI002260C63A|nr:precorrin-6A/cobalt-precorrin-6A reductase [Sulfitobacter sp. F26169L]MCX7566116.1 precorrin-6A/cobalt-precorrin-6A reductase [Sulfitobacter sp. F26169L]